MITVFRAHYQPHWLAEACDILLLLQALPCTESLPVSSCISVVCVLVHPFFM